MLSGTHYAQNYASIIGWSLNLALLLLCVYVYVFVCLPYNMYSLVMHASVQDWCHVLYHNQHGLHQCLCYSEREATLCVCNMSCCRCLMSFCSAHTHTHTHMHLPLLYTKSPSAYRLLFQELRTAHTQTKYSNRTVISDVITSAHC